MFIVDAHEDLAWNILTFGRDYTLSVAETRRREAGTLTPERNDDTLLGWPEYQRGCVAIVFASLFATPARAAYEWETLVYHDARQAHRLYLEQVDLYERWSDDHHDHFRLLRSAADLQDHLARWEGHAAQHCPVESAFSQGAEQESNEEQTPQANSNPPVGLVMLMEGGDAILEAAEVEAWRERGVCLIGPAWRGTLYCGGTLEPGPLTPQGFELLERMADLGMGLDLSHMDERAALQALDAYPSVLFASHSNPARLLKDSAGNRHLSDRLIEGIVERQGVIGVVPFNGFLRPGWRRGDPRQEVSLNHLVKAIDYICQLVGDAQHVGLGSDFDGGFGLQSVPVGIESIADLRRLIPLLGELGYSSQDIAAILGGNWVTILKRVFAEAS